MAVYERATRAVEPAQQYDMFNIYIKRAAEIYGVTHTRGIYQKAIEVPAARGGGGVEGTPTWSCQAGGSERAHAWGWEGAFGKPRAQPGVLGMACLSSLLPMPCPP